MKLIIAGGRDYKFTQQDYARLNALHAETRISTVVSGTARGADIGGEAWANHKNIPVRRFPADWKTHGKSAGPIRNRQMAEYADALALFPGGKGTENMYNEAKRAGITIYDFRDGVTVIRPTAANDSYGASFDDNDWEVAEDEGVEGEGR